MMKPCALTLLLAATMAGTALAESIPVEDPKDPRIKSVVFEENNVVPVHGMTFTSTRIIFGESERILDVEGGDTAGWMVTVKPGLPNTLFLKPTVLGSDSNITVITNKHAYYFHVKSNTTPNTLPASQTYAVRFVYEDVAKAKLHASQARAQAQKPVAPTPKNHDYGFSGNRQIMPLHVFDDGTFTWFELVKNQPVPAIFAVDDKQGKESVVNTRREGNYLVVQRIAPQFTLRHGGMVASIFNRREISRIRQGA